ncbi:MAG: tail fiber protein [Candidatus Saccharimonadota bacterium]
MKKHTTTSTVLRSGFTIIELIVVIAVLAILSVIIVVSYGSWRESINTSAVKSDLAAAATALENARNTGEGYPSTLPSSFTASPNVVITLIPNGGNDKVYCINGSYATASSIQYYVDEKLGANNPTTGTCASRTVTNTPGPVSDVVIGTTVANQIQVQWTIASPNYATGYQVECAQDGAYVLGKITATASGASTSSVFVTGADAVATYYCRVKAVNANGSSDWQGGASGSIIAHTCAETNQYGTYPICYDYDSLAVGTSISGYWTTPPDGYVLEDGSAISRTTYSDLFNLLGTSYGSGDGSTTFNVPDSRGRVTVNISATDTEFDTIGLKFGSKSFTLTTNEMPSHSHAQRVTANSGGSAIRNDWSSDGSSSPYTQGATTGSNGSGASFSILQQSIVKRYAIKARGPIGGTASTLPAGTSMQGYWAVAPSNYVDENGAAVSRAGQAALFSAIGTTYGVGDGSTTFNVPNSTGRVGVNRLAADSYYGNLGQTSGEKRHTLTLAEMASHSHYQHVTANSGGPGIRNDYSSDTAGGLYDQGQATGSAGSGQSFNVIQPSIVKRSTVKTAAASGSQTDWGMQPGTSIEGWWSTAPAGFLLEDGSAVSRTTYANLFAVIGTTFGAGDGSTTFNLPDSRGRVGVNLSATDTEFNTIGKKAGAKTRVMSVAELPAHTHEQYVTANNGCCAIRRDYKSDSSGAWYVQGADTAPAGSSAAFNISQPSITKMFAIKF